MVRALGAATERVGKSGSREAGKASPATDESAHLAQASRLPSSQAVSAILGIDHIGVAVADASEIREYFARVFNLTTSEPEDVGPHRVRFIETGETTIELVEPTSSDSPVAKFIEKRGTALHHICLLVPDIDAALAALVAKGVKLIDERPRPGAHGSRIAFVHPSSAHGLLIEIKQK